MRIDKKIGKKQEISVYVGFFFNVTHGTYTSYEYNYMYP